MVYSIVERHQGRIELESAPDKGTRFAMTFPPSTGAQPEQEDISPLTSTPRRILIIDDEEEITELFGEILKQAGHTVEAVTDPHQGLNLIQTSAFDMVFTDLGMPGMPGWEIAKSVKQHNSNIAVVLITGWGAEFEETKLADNGVDLVLSKPVKTTDLLKAAAELFSNGHESNGPTSN
jgi:CheY-like chemotaxis protein